MRSTARWIPALTKTSAIAAVAAAALIGGLAGPAAASAAPAPATATVSAEAPKPAAPKPASKASVKHSFQLQNTFFNCGPSATRVALSAQGKVYTQAEVGKMLGTTENGTDSAHIVTGVLNKKLGKDRYRTVEIAGPKATKKQIAQLKTDIVDTLSQGDVVVANIAGTITDTNGDTHSYEGGHYIPVVGYSNNGNTVRIADSADTEGSPRYDVSVKTLANWIATRGYSA
jgi:hypothetical protein